jgi:nucleoid DNA-binding protein
MTTDIAANDPRTLTKAELAEMLFDRVGLNKREAKDIVDTIFRCEINLRAQDATRKQVKQFRSPHVVW